MINRIPVVAAAQRRTDAWRANTTHRPGTRVRTWLAGVALAASGAARSMGLAAHRPNAATLSWRVASTIALARAARCCCSGTRPCRTRLAGAVDGSARRLVEVLPEGPPAPPIAITDESLAAHGAHAERQIGVAPVRSMRARAGPRAPLSSQEWLACSSAWQCRMSRSAHQRIF